MQPFADRNFLTGANGTGATPDHRDAQLACAVVAGLSAEARTRDRTIRVRAQNGVVILDGTVPTTGSRAAATACAWRVAGVSDVCNALSVTGQAVTTEFDRVVAPLRRTGDAAVRRSRMPWFVVVLLSVMWLAVPAALIVGSWPALLLAVAALAVTSRELLSGAGDGRAARRSRR